MPKARSVGAGKFRVGIATLQARNRANRLGIHAGLKRRGVLNKGQLPRLYLRR